MEDQIKEIIVTKAHIEIVTMDNRRMKFNKQYFSNIFSKLESVEVAHLRFHPCQSCGES